MINHLWTVFRKEILDNSRDRRAVFNALFTVMLNPLIYIFLFGFLNRSFSEQGQRPLFLAVVGPENAPSLIQFLQQQDVTILPPPADPQAAVRSGNADMVLLIPDDYGENFRNGHPATVQLLIDETNQGASVTINRIERILERYSCQIGNLRLIARGISPAITVAVPIETINLAPQSAAEASIILNLLPVVMITAAFFGGFYLAVDMTAGERERESLEPLLLNPVPRWRIFLGKYLTAFVFTVLATFLATSFFLVLLGIPQVQRFTALRINLGLDVIVTAVLLMVPVVFMAVALEMLVASYARTVKEAQTYTQLLAMVGFLPAVFLSVLPITAQPWMKLIPVISQLFLINNVSRGDGLNSQEVILASAITMAAGLIALRLSVRLYNREQIILGR